MNKIKKIPEFIVNQIAAGEIVERPASIVKELIENSLDANAKKIEISLVEAGKASIVIKDDGVGIAKEDLHIAIEAHTTSKLDNDYNLWNINTFGFRGEALSSIANVSRVMISSQTIADNGASKLVSQHGHTLSVLPTKSMKGTIIEVNDLFFSIPARLKFLKNNKTELLHCIKIVQAIAICNQDTEFTLFSDGKQQLHYPATASKTERFAQVITSQLADNLFQFDEIAGSYKISAITSIPNFNKPNSNYMFVFVNGRFIRNFLINRAIRDAYSDTIPHNNYPISAVFLDMPTKDVDVNVHPAKTEVKFVDSFAVQALVKASFQKHISSNSKRSIVNTEQNFLLSANTVQYAGTYAINSNNYSKNTTLSSKPTLNTQRGTSKTNFAGNQFASQLTPPTTEPINLGTAIVQLSNKYIISVQDTEMFIIDQHAAHERIVYEKLKKDFFKKSIDSQMLLSPHLISFKPVEIDLLANLKDYFKDIGLVFDKLDECTLAVKSVPSLMKNYDLDNLFETLLAEVDTYQSSSVEDKVKSILATIACHNSIRAGRNMNISEMNALLRSMEEIQNSAQCNHGRPSYFKLSIHELDKFFERS